jgi:flagellar biosynthesis chaperone FliJ
VIVERVNALVIVEGLENYENFVRTLNEIIAKYAAMIVRKKRLNQNGQNLQNLQNKEISISMGGSV